MLIAKHQNKLARRAAFTLLEVLVVVAIIVILAGGASIYVFGYLEDARMDTARNNITLLESQCKAYMAQNGGIPPASLTELVAPTDGRSPKLDGGLSALLDPWGQQYQYDPSAVDNYGAPDPIVSTVTPKGIPLTSNKRR
jgi:general secretion pathway protein G